MSSISSSPKPMSSAELPTAIAVLLVEDDADDAELALIELERSGFVVSHQRVETEGEFLRALEARHWDIVLSDFRMPSFDGLRAFALLQAHHPDVPFIFVSGALGEERAVEAMRAGARDYLLKGKLQRLAVAVRRELERSHQQRLRLEAEAARDLEQRRLAVALEATQAGVFELHLGEAPGLWFSEQCAGLLGLRPDELPALPGFAPWLRWLVHADDLERLLRAYGDLLHGQDARMNLGLRLRHAHGGWREVRCFGMVAARGGDGAARQLVGVVLDETEQSRLEAELRQAQKMEAIGRLAGGIAHDFNNLLTAMFSFGRFALDSLAPDSQPHRDLQEVLRAAESAERLTRQLLAFSRRQTIQPRIVVLDDIIANISQMLRRTLGDDVACRIDRAGERWSARIDPGSFEQLVLNLAINARDAMTRGGQLDIATRTVRLAAPLQGAGDGRALEPGEYVQLTVSDNGIGMSAETLERVFEPFFTTKDPTRGTGLGLSTCYGIVKQADGAIRVASEPGRGTTVEVYLPRAHGPLGGATPSRPQGRLSGTERILVVEDNPVVRLLSVRVLAGLGYTVLQASDGTEALRLCAKLAEPVDLVLTDVMMPNMGGRELAERLAQASPTSRILFVSGYTADEITHDNILADGVELLHKPFTPESLAHKVREVLDHDHGPSKRTERPT